MSEHLIHNSEYASEEFKTGSASPAEVPVLINPFCNNWVSLILLQNN